MKKYPTKEQKRKMELFKKAYKENLLNKAKASDKIGISRATVYNWLDKFDTFKKEIEEIEEEIYDEVEAKIRELALDGNVTMLIFFAKTKMKHRGYTEREENKLDEDAGIDVVIHRK